MTRQGKSVFGVAVLVVVVVARSGVLAVSPPSRKPAPQPAAKGPNPATAVAAGRLAEVLSKSPTALGSFEQDAAVQILLRVGDVASAERLLDVPRTAPVQNRTVGQLCAMLPGGPQGARAGALLAKHRVTYREIGTLEGVAIGYAQAGNVRQALAEVQKLKDPELQRPLLAELMTVCPVQPFIDAYLRTDRLLISSQHAERLLRAYLVLNQAAKADELAREIRAVDAALKAGGAYGKGRMLLSTGEAERVLFRGMFFGRLAAGGIDQAVAVEQERFDKALAAAKQAKDASGFEFSARNERQKAYQAIVAALALKGDAAGARAKADVVKGSPAVDVPLAYAISSAGDAAAVDAFVAAIPPTPAWSGTPDYRPAVLGAASAGRFAAGDKAGAERYAQQALALVPAMKRPKDQAAALFQILAATALGPEAMLIVEQRLETYPLRLPPK